MYNITVLYTCIYMQHISSHFIYFFRVWCLISIPLSTRKLCSKCMHDLAEDKTICTTQCRCGSLYHCRFWWNLILKSRLDSKISNTKSKCRTLISLALAGGQCDGSGYNRTLSKCVLTSVTKTEKFVFDSPLKFLKSWISFSSLLILYYITRFHLHALHCIYCKALLILWHYRTNNYD